MTSLPSRTVTRRSVLQAAALGALAMPFVARRALGIESLEQDIGSMLIFSFSGAAGAQALAGHMRAGRAGGVNFLGNNIGTRAEVLALTTLFRQARPDALMAIDQEGGAVQRLSTGQGVRRIPRARDVPGSMSTAEATEMYRAAGLDLAAMGFNYNLAPVVDIHRSGNPIIARYGRAFSDDPQIITDYAAACIAGFAAAGLAISIKHFPGHGSSAADSHEGPVDISDSWNAGELLPYQRLIRQGVVSSVMIGHLMLRQQFQSDLPATLSPVAIQGMLRRDMDYDEVVITDDLDMNAIRAIMPFQTAVVSAVAAGNDILLISNSVEQDPDLPAIVVGWIAAAVGAGTISRAQIAESAARIQRMKARLPVAPVTGAAGAVVPRPRPAGPPGQMPPP